MTLDREEAKSSPGASQRSEDRQDWAKLKNLRRNPHRSLLVSKSDRRGYLALEGRATVMSADNADAEELRLALREVYREAAGTGAPQLGRL